MKHQSVLFVRRETGKKNYKCVQINDHTQLNVRKITSLELSSFILDMLFVFLCSQVMNKTEE